MEKIKLLLKETKLDIFAVTEKHIHKNLSGDTLKYYHIEMDDEPPEMEFIWIEILLNYKSCSSTASAVLRQIFPFRTIISRVCYGANIIIGNFSIDLDLTKTPRNPLSKDLLLLLNECNMKNTITNHTHITDHYKSLIDSAKTGNPSKVTNSGIRPTGIRSNKILKGFLGTSLSCLMTLMMHYGAGSTYLNPLCQITLKLKGSR